MILAITFTNALMTLLGLIVVGFAYLMAFFVPFFGIYSIYRAIRGQDLDGKPMKDKENPHIWW